ncbi:MAG: hypothetical protein KC461_10665 [Dehalococcoidia bacterium]|nr:hypothetical protein [Dehalococcoidia bacterium]MCA9851087.1 hypothetical protein [Dehalococcoidia bacterium]
MRALDAATPLPPAWSTVAATRGSLGYVAGVLPLVRLLLTHQADAPATPAAAR